jgi:dephospho-CoA kinase
LNQRIIKPVKVIGLTGGAGSGKTEAAHFFSAHHCEVLDLDQLGRTLFAEFPEIKQGIIATFGDSVTNHSGDVDRGALRRKVFTDPAAMEQLDAIYYPFFRERVKKITANFRKKGEGALVIDGAILTDAQLDQYVDKMVLVRCSFDVQTARVAKRMDIPLTMAEALVKSQNRKLPRDSEITAVIENNGTLEELQNKVDLLFTQFIPKEG